MGGTHQTGGDGDNEWQYGQVVAFVIIGTLVLLTSLLILLIILNILLTRKHREIERRAFEKDSVNTKTAATDIEKNDNNDDSVDGKGGKEKKLESSESDSADTPTPISTPTTASTVVLATGETGCTPSSGHVVPSPSKGPVFTYLTSLSEEEENISSSRDCSPQSANQKSPLRQVKIDIEQSAAANEIQVRAETARANREKRNEDFESEFCETNNVNISSPESNSPTHSTGPARIGTGRRSGSGGSQKYGTFDVSSAPDEFSSSAYSSPHSVRFDENSQYGGYQHSAVLSSPPSRNQSGNRLTHKKISTQKDDQHKTIEQVQLKKRVGVDYF